jgi:hypothetical protein
MLDELLNLLRRTTRRVSFERARDLIVHDAHLHADGDACEVCAICAVLDRPFDPVFVLQIDHHIPDGSRDYEGIYGTFERARTAATTHMNIWKEIDQNEWFVHPEGCLCSSSISTERTFPYRADRSLFCASIDTDEEGGRVLNIIEHEVL